MIIVIIGFEGIYDGKIHPEDFFFNQPRGRGEKFSRKGENFVFGDWWLRIEEPMIPIIMGWFHFQVGKLAPSLPATQVPKPALKQLPVWPESNRTPWLTLERPWALSAQTKKYMTVPNILRKYVTRMDSSKIQGMQPTRQNVEWPKSVTTKPFRRTKT